VEIGIIGIGLMGKAFLERFRSQGYSVRVFNRNPLELAPDSDVIVCASVDELIDTSSTIILMLSNAEAINDLIQLNQASETQRVLQGKTFLQMATISPDQSRQVAVAIAARGGHYLEAPVLGSLPEARTGTLIIMAAGSKQLFEHALPVLQILGTAPRYIGDTGSAAALKLAMNQLIASLTAGFALSLCYAIRNGVDSELFMQTVRESALYAKTYDKKLNKYLQRDFGAANFSTRHLLKDIRLFIDDAQSSGLNTDALEGIERITRSTVEKGLDRMDYSSIFEVICPDTDNKT